MATLTAGAIQRIVTMGEMGISAVLQVLTCEEMAAQNGKIRWRCVCACLRAREEGERDRAHLGVYCAVTSSFLPLHSAA